MTKEELEFLKVIFGVFRKDIYLNMTNIDQSNNTNIASINLEAKVMEILSKEEKKVNK